MAPLRKCITTVALSGSLPEKLEAAAAVGFGGVEIMEADLLSFDGSPAAVRRIAESPGLGIDLYQPFRDFEAMPDAALDVTGFLRAVLASGYAGPLSLEVFNDDFRGPLPRPWTAWSSRWTRPPAATWWPSWGTWVSATRGGADRRRSSFIGRAGSAWS